MTKLDTLVFYLCEYEYDAPHRKDLQLFVLYDFEREAYAVYGSRQEGTDNKDLLPKIRPFNFYIDDTDDVFDFICSVVNPSSNFLYSVYAMSGLPVFMSDITYSLLSNFRRRTHEIAGWESKSLDTNRLRNMLPLTCKAYSLYEFEEDVYEDW